jgi:predicted restriction endonuclease
MNDFHESLSDLKQDVLGLKMARIGGRSRPHKPILLLAVLDLIEAGHIRENKIFLDQELVGAFASRFREFASDGDWCQPVQPFFHLRSSPFWLVLFRIVWVVGSDFIHHIQARPQHLVV